MRFSNCRFARWLFQNCQASGVVYYTPWNGLKCPGMIRTNE